MEENKCEHEWEFEDDSFDHEFGTEVIQYYVCIHCGEVADDGQVRSIEREQEDE